MIEPITRKKGFFHAETSNHKFKEYPGCKYSLDSAKIRLKVEMKPKPLSSMTSLKYPPLIRNIPSLMENLDSDSIMTDPDKSIIFPNTDKYLSSESQKDVGSV